MGFTAGVQQSQSGTPIEPRCARCRFFGQSGATEGLTVGLCRYQPPVHFDAAGYGIWPVVHESDFCGHFVSAPIPSPIPSPPIPSPA